ncbi:MAG: hypothetical protein Q4C46_02980 [Bacillota bacterium]|nr:hypothetical protein [Bacillota bacterium]
MSVSGDDKFILAGFGLSGLEGEPIRGGTLYAMPPEVVNSRILSESSDIYSLCASMYYLISSTPPKARVKVGSGIGILEIGYDGIMPEPSEASDGFQKLLVNQLEFRKDKRNCNSIKSLREALENLLVEYDM